MNGAKHIPNPGWAWCGGGLGGGAVAGMLDGLWTLVGGRESLGIARGLELLVAALSLGAVAGAMLGLGLALLGRGAAGLRSDARAQRRAGHSFAGRMVWAQPEAVLAALVAAPLLIFDAVALFSGRRAAALPARSLLVVLVAILAIVAVYCVVRAFRALLGGTGRIGSGLVATLTALAAVLVHGIDRLWLPRLYPWFHATLTLTSALLLVVAATIALRVRRMGRRGTGRTRAYAGWRVATVVLLVVVAGVALVRLRDSQVLRFVAHEQTRLTGLVLRVISPGARPRSDGLEAEDAAAEVAGSLPAGPLRPAADVVLITVDALRADHVHAYGYSRPVTPAIDRLAGRSTRFDRAYAQAPHTSFSITSLLTGNYHATVARLAPGAMDETLAQVMGRQGWTTAAFYPPAVFFNDGVQLKGYAENHYGFEHVKHDDADAERRIDQVVHFFDAAQPKRALVWVHLFEPHEPYESRPTFAFGPRDVDRYDSEIAYTDRAVGRLLTWLARHRPQAVVVLSADHGEEFDEHGGRYHGSTLYDEQVRVPLLIEVPGVRPHVVRGPVQLIDVAPTVLGLVGLDPPSTMRGNNLGPWLARPPAAEQRLPPAFAEVGDKRMVALGHEKLICDLNWGYCAYYDLARDPLESHNAADEEPERLRALRGELDDWLDDHFRREPRFAGAAGDGEDLAAPRAIERGRLGDLGAVPGLVGLLVPELPASTRREAAQLLATLPARQETAPPLLAVRTDKDPVVADWVAVGLLRLGQPAGRTRSRSIVGDEGRGWRLRVHAALALAGLGERDSVPFLLEVLEREDDVPLRRLVIQQLGRLKDARAVPVLLALLEDVRHRLEIVEALGEIGDGRARAALIERLLGDGYVPVRLQAALALAKLGDSVAIPALETAAREDTEPSVVEAAASAVERLRAAL